MMQSTLRVPYRAPTRLERSPFDFAAIFSLLLLVVLLIGLLTWQFWYASRIYSGVTVAGVPVGGLTRARALTQLAGRLQNYPPPPVNLFYAGQQWPLTSDQIKAQADWLAAVNQAYLVGRQGNFSARTVRQLLTAVRGQDVIPPLTFDVGQLRYAIGQVAKDVRRPARAASQIGNVKVAGQPGLDVDVEATVQAVLKALQLTPPDQIINVPLAVVELPPPAAATVAQAPTTTISVATPAPILLRDEKFNLQFALDSATVNGLIHSTKPLRLDEDGLRKVLTDWAAQVDLPARDARLHFDVDTGALTVLQPSQNGRKLDVDATLNAIRQAVGANQTQVPLVMVDEPPAVDMNKIAEMGIRELVASGVTYFKGSSAERIQNIQVGASKLTGVVIPPNQVFSFNQFVEDVNSANGFADALIIWGDQTAVGAGGGICQVSTTVFRAAYTGGFSIVERYNHGYVVGWYGEPGLDATIFTPRVDFRFRNDTDAYLLIEPAVDATNGVIRINFYGTKPNRQVQLKPAVHSDVIDPPPAQYKVDESLAKGQMKQVETEHKGMTVNIERVIVENGTTRTDTLVSKYEPWRAVYLVGPGTEIPHTAEVTPTLTSAVTTTVDTTPMPDHKSAP